MAIQLYDSYVAGGRSFFLNLPGDVFSGMKRRLGMMEFMSNEAPGAGVRCFCGAEATVAWHFICNGSK